MAPRTPLAIPSNSPAPIGTNSSPSSIPKTFMAFLKIVPLSIRLSIDFSYSLLIEVPVCISSLAIAWYLAYSSWAPPNLMISLAAYPPKIFWRAACCSPGDMPGLAFTASTISIIVLTESAVNRLLTSSAETPKNSPAMSRPLRPVRFFSSYKPVFLLRTCSVP